MMAEGAVVMQQVREFLNHELWIFIFGVSYVRIPPTSVYDPPHCVGYENGEIREGFTIPCGRGRDGAVIFYYFMAFITFCIIPVVICISLRMIYRAVKLQEKRSSR